MTTTIDVLAMPAPPPVPRAVAKGRAQAPGQEPGHANSRAAEVAHPFAEALAAQQPSPGNDTPDDPTDDSGPDRRPVAEPPSAAHAGNSPAAVAVLPDVQLVLASLPPVADPPGSADGVAAADPEDPGAGPVPASMPVGTVLVAGVDPSGVDAVDLITSTAAPEPTSQETGLRPTAPAATARPIGTPVAPEPPSAQGAGMIGPASRPVVDARPEGTVTGGPVVEPDMRSDESERPVRPQVGEVSIEDGGPGSSVVPAGRLVEPASPERPVTGGPVVEPDTRSAELGRPVRPQVGDVSIEDGGPAASVVPTGRLVEPASPAPASTPSPAPTSTVLAPPAAMTGTPGTEISTVARSDPGAAAEQATSSAQPWQQVVEVLRPLKRLSDGSHRLSIRLRPEELGTVHVELSLHRGSLSLHLVAEHAAARDLLARSLGSLRAELEAAGVRTGWLDVGSRTAQEQGTPGGSPRGTASWVPAGRNDRLGGVPASVPLLTLPAARPVAADGRLDLRL